MSKKNKQPNSSTQNTVPPKKDIFNVKDNLNKLRSGTGKDEYETKSNIDSTKASDSYYGTTHKEDTGLYSSTSTTDRFEKINDKFSSDISVLKDTLTEHKEKISEKLNDKLDKAELKYWIGGIIAGILLIGSIVYTLSYQNVITDVKDLKDNKSNTKSSLDKVEFKIEQIEKMIPDSRGSKSRSDSNERN